MTIHMHRYARIVGMSPRELELFAELWPIMHAKEKGPHETDQREDHDCNPILPQTEPDAYADANQICLEI